MSLLAYEEADAVITVPMNGIEFCDFRTRIKAIGTRNLAGCHVVIIASQYGALMAHISPHPGQNFHEPLAGDHHVANMMLRLRRKYLSYHAQNFFPATSDTWTVHAEVRGTIALPDQRTIIRDHLTAMELPNPREHYYRPNPAEANRRDSRAGTVILIGSTLPAKLYVEDVYVNPEDDDDDDSG